MYPILDDGNNSDFDTSPMSNYNAFPVILQFSSRLCQEPGMDEICVRKRWKLIVLFIVLAIIDHLLIFRPIVTGSPLSCLLPTTLLAPTRRVLGPISSTIYLAHSLCHFLSLGFVPSSQHSIPWIGTIEFSGVYLEQKESGDEAELPGTAGLYSAISTVGIDGFFTRATWHCAEG